MTLCGVCGEPALHGGRCIDVLKRALRDARDRIRELESASNIPRTLEHTSNSPLESASNTQHPVRAKSNGSFNKLAYQREYMRKRRAEGKA